MSEKIHFMFFCVISVRTIWPFSFLASSCTVSPAGSVKDVPRAFSGVVNPDGCSVGRIRPRFRLPGLAGRADKDVLNGRAFQNPGENPFPRNMAFLVPCHGRQSIPCPRFPPTDRTSCLPPEWRGVCPGSSMLFQILSCVCGERECILPSRGEETETGTLISRAIPGKGVLPVPPQEAIDD